MRGRPRRSRAAPPFPASGAGGVGGKERLGMTRCLHSAAEHHTVGWYQSSSLDSCQTQEMLDDFICHHYCIRRCVCIVYDPQRSARGQVAAKAIRLKDTFITPYKLTGKALREAGVDWRDVFVEVPIKLGFSLFGSSRRLPHHKQRALLRAVAHVAAREQQRGAVSAAAWCINKAHLAPDSWVVMHPDRSRAAVFSFSQPHVVHEVAQPGTTWSTCTCEAGSRGMLCWHQARAAFSTRGDSAATAQLFTEGVAGRAARWLHAAQQQRAVAAARPPPDAERVCRASPVARVRPPHANAWVCDCGCLWHTGPALPGERGDGGCCLGAITGRGLCCRFGPLG